ncbi:hypothetical protein [Streptomyces zagrosensis]|uniref:Gram-positive cocci surface proteins LPxTG domain-containing protein n=1 Tax=Streptomyces zagrosensis TaxID=1042984 RepID=A0A7W9QA19_9ACTN|nr:hypothetical protein [Streptomyces zagrosensis]MBB5936319.1 hypothetical protein [Streptomyces zagrosensis]
MTTSVPLRVTGARSAAVAVAALAIGGAVLVGAPTSGASSPGASSPGGGDVKIHRVGTPVQDSRDERKVCAFYLAAADVTGSQDLTWQIAPQPNPRNQPGIGGNIAIESGSGHTGPHTLPSGKYQLTWSGADQQDAANRKMFMVECPPGDQGQPETNGPLPPAAGAERAPADGEKAPAGEEKAPADEKEQPPAAEQGRSAASADDRLTDVVQDPPAESADDRQNAPAAPAGPADSAAEQPAAPDRSRTEQEHLSATGDGRPGGQNDEQSPASGAEQPADAGMEQPRGAVAAGGGGTADVGVPTKGVGTALAAGAVVASGLILGRRVRRRSGQAV